ncbi:UNVERIFIED_CONTAM: hypothetical protein RMT77_014699 [Armadillidium vulgare]
MNFFIIMGTLCIFLDVNGETKLRGGCELYLSDESSYTLPYGHVCIKAPCDWSVDSSCKKGITSKVLQWETDIFEIGFEESQARRPNEVIVKIDLNKDYYIEIKVLTDETSLEHKEQRLDIILNECSHKEKKCLKNLNLTHNNVDSFMDQAFVAIGFRKDKKLNFATQSYLSWIASDRFSKENVYETKMPGFYFNTDETMNITVYSPFDKNYDYEALRITLPTSVGGLAFNNFGYLTNDNDYCCVISYRNNNEDEGLSYIIKEYYDNSEDWKAIPVIYTPDTLEVQYFNENGMQKSQDEMKVKKAPNPHFDKTTMKREVCLYVRLPTTLTTPTTPTTPTTKLMEESKKTEVKDSKTTKADDSKEKEVPITQSPLDKDKRQVIPLQSFEAEIPLPEVTINKVTFIRKDDPLESNININDFLNRVGNKSVHQDFLKNISKGGSYETIKLINGSFFDIYKYKFAPPKDGKKNVTKKIGSGGAGDASTGQKQAKIISQKYIIILILMILSV